MLIPYLEPASVPCNGGPFEERLFSPRPFHPQTLPPLLFCAWLFPPPQGCLDGAEGGEYWFEEVVVLAGGEGSEHADSSGIHSLLSTARMERFRFEVIGQI
jgi:hypothetical protein